MKVFVNTILISFLSLQSVIARSSSSSSSSSYYPSVDPRSPPVVDSPVVAKPPANHVDRLIISPLTTDNNNLSREEIELIKQRILDGLGMKSIPAFSMTNFTQDEINEAYRDYAKAVESEDLRYQALMDQEDLRDDEDQDDEEEDDEEEEEETNSKSVNYEFFSTKITKSTSGRNRRAANSREQIIHFFVALPSTVDLNTTSIVEANSRLWKRGRQSIPENDTYSGSSTLEVSFYRLDNIPRGKVAASTLNPIYMGSHNISRYGSDWLQVDMTEAVRTWIRHPYIDNGILLRCPNCEAAGVRFVTGGRKKALTSGSKVPRLNVRTEIMGVRRIKRSHKIRKRNKLAECHDATHPRGRKSKRCCRRSMQVRFVDLPRFDFILSPKEFDAFYCSGRCPPRYNPATQHALFQSLVNLRGENNVPKPCCAPTKLKGLNILHIGEDGRMKTTFWSDVIVTECGCA